MIDMEINKEAKGTRQKTSLYKNKCNKEKRKQRLKWRKFGKEKEKFNIKSKESFQNIDESNLYK